MGRSSYDDHDRDRRRGTHSRKVEPLNGLSMSTIPAGGPTTMPPPSALTFDQFITSNEFLYLRMLTGTWRIDTGPYSTAALAVPVALCTEIVTPKIELWDAYWEIFFSRLDTYESRLKQQLNAETELLRQAKNNKTRIVVRADVPAMLASPLDASGYPIDFVNIVKVAETFGALVGLHVHDKEVSLQFTSYRSAELFMLHVMNFGIVMSNGGKCGGDLPRFGIQEYNTSKQGSVFSVDPDMKSDLDSADGIKNVLVLGPLINLPVPYVVALFGDIFGATVEFRPEKGCYHLTFKSIREARYCLHVLHRSMHSVFGLSLLQLAPPDMNQWAAPCHAIRF